MPLYVYKCAKCGHEFEKIEKLSAPHTQKCPKCKKGRAERQLSSPAFQFKGSGWYVTDYARKGAPPLDKAEKSEKKEGKEAAESKEGKDTKEVKEVKEAKGVKEEGSKKEKKSGKDK